MKVLKVLVLIVLFATSMPAGAAEPTLKELDAALEADLKHIEEVVRVLTAVKDEKSAKVAVPRLRELEKRKPRADALGKSTSAEIQAALKTKYEARFQQTLLQLSLQASRIALDERLKEVADEMDAAAKRRLDQAPPDVPDEVPPTGEWQVETIVPDPKAPPLKLPAELRGHKDDPQVLAFSPDGRLLASSAFGSKEPVPRSIRVWDLKTGKTVMLLKGPPPSGECLIEQLAFSPDGNTLVSSDNTGVVQIWDLQERKAVKTLQFRDTVQIYAPLVVYAADGKTFAVANSASIASVSSVTGKTLASVRLPSGGIAMKAAVSANGASVAVYKEEYKDDGKDGVLQTWDVAKGKLLWKVGPPAVFTGLAFAPDGKTLLAYEQNSGDIIRYDASTGARKSAANIGVNADDVAFSGDRRLAVDCSIAGSDVFEVETGKKVRLVYDGTHARAVAISWAGSLVAIETQGGVIKLQPIGPAGTNAAEGGGAPAMILDLKGHTKLVRDLDYSPDGKWLASCSGDKTLRIWDAASGELKKTHNLEAMAVRFLCDGKTLALHVGEQSDELRGIVLVDLATGRPQQKLFVKGDKAFDDHWFRGVTVSTDGSVACVGSDGLAFWKMPRAELKGFVQQEGLDTASIAVSADGKRAATGNGQLWDLTKGTPLGSRHDSIDSPRSRTVAFSPDSKVVAFLPDNFGLVICNAATGAELRKVSFGSTGSMESCVFSPNGKLIAVCGYSQIDLLDPETGEEILELSLPRKGIGSIVFSPDGRRLAAGGSEGELEIWDVSAFATMAKSDRRPASSATIPATPVKPAAEPLRKWTSADGKFQVEAQRLGQTAENVELKTKDGRTIQVPRANLSEPDREYLNERD